MNPKLDQLRKRYANPSAQPDASGAYALGPRSITADHAEEQPTISDTNADTHSPFGQGPAPVAGIAEHNRKDGSPAIEERHPTDIVRDVEALFEPARNYRDHVALSFEAIRALRSELNVLAQSAESLKGLQDRIIEIFDSIRAQLGDLAMSVEATKALRPQLSVLVQTLAAGTELEAQVHELSKMLVESPGQKLQKMKRRRLKRQNQSNPWTSLKIVPIRDQIQVGPWSLALSHPRTSRSTPARPDVHP